MKKITLGMCCYDDFDGVYFSVQANRILHPLIDSDGEVLVIDNNPNSHAGKMTARFCKAAENVRYIPYTKRRGTAVREILFTHATGEIVICIDSHVILHAHAIESIIETFSHFDSPTLIQGPLVFDNLREESKRWVNIWRNGFHGYWETRQPISKSEASRDEIDNMGLGAFAARRSEWPGFHPLFRGFGGEEGYIHRKYQKMGGSCLSIPEFKWTHRFYRVHGQSYPSSLADHLYNYFIGSFELGEKPDRIIEHYATRLNRDMIRAIYERARRDYLHYSGDKHAMLSI